MTELPSSKSFVVEPHGSRDLPNQTVLVYTVVSDCAVLFNAAGQRFTPLSSLVTSDNSISNHDYFLMFTSLRSIWKLTGTFWFDLRSYRRIDAPFRNAVRSIFVAMNPCGAYGDCQRFETLAAAFIQEHLANDADRDLVRTAFPNYGSLTTTDGNWKELGFNKGTLSREIAYTFDDDSLFEDGYVNANYANRKQVPPVVLCLVSIFILVVQFMRRPR